MRPLGVQIANAGESLLEVAFGARTHEVDLDAECLSGQLHLPELRFGRCGVVWIEKHTSGRRGRQQLALELESLGTEPDP
jgi:hypothetical protein